MGLLPNKSGLLIGSLIGSALGLLFARETGKSLRIRLASARTPQKKFEVLFQEYLKVGSNAFHEVESGDALSEIVAGGREILEQLKKRAQREGGEAVKFAENKTAEIIAEAEKAVRSKTTAAVKKTAATAKKVVKRAATKAKKVIAKAKPVAKNPRRK